MRRVASVLGAMRLPYAALRVLPPDSAASTESVRTWCYLELAHRHRRHSGETSLLDQYRAVARLRKSHPTANWTTDEMRRAAYSLEGLGVPMRNRRFAVGESRAGQQEGGWSHCAASENGDLKSKSATPAGASISESQLRRAMAEGDVAACRRLVSKLEGKSRNYYDLLVSANTSPPSQLYPNLRALIDANDLPERLRGESLLLPGMPGD